MKTILVKSIGTYINILSYVHAPYATNRALHLFTKPRGGKVNPNQLEFLSTAQQEQLQFEDYPVMTYRWKGNRKTILLIHGWESNSARWKNLIYNLKKKNYNIVAVDAPAHGQSGGKYFNALLYAEFINIAVQRYNPEVIIGHSVGGMASVFFQYKYQWPQLEKMVLLGSPSEFKDVMKRYTDMLGYNQRIITKLESSLVTKFGQDAEDFSTARFVKQINSEALIIHDQHDHIIPYADAVSIQKSFRNSRLITTDGLGHSLIDDSVVNHIYTFLEA